MDLDAWFAINYWLFVLISIVHYAFTIRILSQIVTIYKTGFAIAILFYNALWMWDEKRENSELQHKGNTHLTEDNCVTHTDIPLEMAKEMNKTIQQNETDRATDTHIQREKDKERKEKSRTKKKTYIPTKPKKWQRQTVSCSEKPETIPNVWQI